MPDNEASQTNSRRAINQHVYRHHGRLTLRGTTEQRLSAHDDLHWEAKKNGVDLGHVHLPYQDGEDELGMARRLLQEGEEGLRAQQLRELGATAPQAPQE